MGSSTYGGFGLASETMRRVTEDITGITGASPAASNDGGARRSPPNLPSFRRASR